jgi:hypothetical protein
MTEKDYLRSNEITVILTVQRTYGFLPTQHRLNFDPTPTLVDPIAVYRRNL